MGIYAINSHAVAYTELPKGSRATGRIRVNSRGLHLDDRSRFEIR